MPTPTEDKDILIYEEDGVTVDALGGKDVIYLAGGRNIVHGGDGDDRIFGRDGWDAIYGDAGKDLIFGGSGPGELFGGDGHDEIHTGAGSGQDAYGGEGNDKIYGDDGENWFFGEAGKDLIYAGGGDDLLEGGEGNDRLYGEDGRDEIWGDSGNDRLYGGAGSDFLYGGLGKDEIDGGDGVDYAYFDGNFSDFRIHTNSEGVTIVEDLRSGTRDSGTDKLVNVERLRFADQTMVVLSDPDADAHFSGAVSIGPGDLQGGIFSAATELEYRHDIDIWSVSLAAGQSVTVSARAVDEEDGPDPLLAVFGSDGQLLVTDQDFETGPRITFEAQAAGIYYFAVSDDGYVPTGAQDLASGPHYAGIGRVGDYVFSLEA